MSNLKPGPQSTTPPPARSALPAGAPGPTWGTTTSPGDVAERLRARKVVVITHAKPDGDAAGSALGLARAIELTGGRAEVWFSGPCPAWITQLAGPTPVRLVRAPDPGPNAPSGPVPADANPAPVPGFEPDVVAVVDTGSWGQIGDAAPFVRARRERTLVIDHHLHGDTDTADVRLVVPRAAAACQIVADVALALLRAPSHAAFPLNVAEPLYLGLATDTGWFKHDNVTPEVLRLAADLLDAGVQHARLYAATEQNDPPNRLKLMSRSLATLEFHAAGRLATQLIRRQDFLDTGAERTDTWGLVDLPLTIASVEVSAVLIEEPGASGVVKISLRSKTPTPGKPSLDVNALAKNFSGGGHARAAGAKMSMPIDQAARTLAQAVSAALDARA